MSLSTLVITEWRERVIIQLIQRLDDKNKNDNQGKLSLQQCFDLWLVVHDAICQSYRLPFVVFVVRDMLISH